VIDVFGNGLVSIAIADQPKNTSLIGLHTKIEDGIRSDCSSSHFSLSKEVPLNHGDTLSSPTDPLSSKHETRPFGTSLAGGTDPNQSWEVVTKTKNELHEKAQKGPCC